MEGFLAHLKDNIDRICAQLGQDPAYVVKGSTPLVIECLRYQYAHALADFAHDQHQTLDYFHQTLWELPFGMTPEKESDYIWVRDTLQRYLGYRCP